MSELTKVVGLLVKAVPLRFLYNFVLSVFLVRARAGTRKMPFSSVHLGTLLSCLTLSFSAVKGDNFDIFTPKGKMSMCLVLSIKEVIYKCC